METITDTKVKVINHTFQGAPSLGPDWGSLNTVLKACLVDGFGEVTATSISYDAAKKELVLTGEEVEFAREVVVKVSGHSNEKVNKEFRVKTTAPGKVVLGVKEDLGSVASSPVKVKIAPLGFSIAYDDAATSGTVCYKNTNTEYPAILKVIDKVPPNNYNQNWGRFARVVVGEHIDGSGVFLNDMKTPKHATFPDIENTGNKVAGAGGIHGWTKWYYGVSTIESAILRPEQHPAQWCIVGDSDTFYLFIQSTGNSKEDRKQMYGFGLYNAVGLKKDVFLVASSTELSANSNLGATMSPNNNILNINWDDANSLFLHRLSTGEYGGTLNLRAGLHTTGFMKNTYRPQTWQGITFLNPITGEALVEKAHIATQIGEKAYRGTMRGLRIPIGENSVQNLTRYGNYINVLARGPENQTSNQACVFFDLKGWEE